MCPHGITFGIYVFHGNPVFLFVDDCLLVGDKQHVSYIVFDISDIQATFYQSNPCTFIFLIRFKVEFGTKYFNLYLSGKYTEWEFLIFGDFKIGFAVQRNIPVGMTETFQIR